MFVGVVSRSYFYMRFDFMAIDKHQWLQKNHRFISGYQTIVVGLILRYIVIWRLLIEMGIGTSIIAPFSFGSSPKIFLGGNSTIVAAIYNVECCPSNDGRVLFMVYLVLITIR